MGVGRTTIPFDTGAGTQNLNYPLGKLALDGCDWIRATLELTKADTDAADTMDVFLQERGPVGVWDDRIHFSQVIGTLSPSASVPETLKAALQQAGTLSDTEEQNEPSGSAGASHITAGTVVNGPFPGSFYDATTRQRDASWRIRIEVVDSDNDADFEGNVHIEFNDAVG